MAKKTFTLQARVSARDVAAIHRFMAKTTSTIPSRAQVLSHAVESFAKLLSDGGLTTMPATETEALRYLNAVGLGSTRGARRAQAEALLAEEQSGLLDILNNSNTDLQDMFKATAEEEGSDDE